jgi:sugar phosphate permease
MQGTNNILQSENTSANFSKGWGIVFYCMAMFFLLIGFSIDGLNIVAPAFAKANGFEYSSVLSMASLAGFVGLIAYYIIGRINILVGPRIVSGACLIGAGVSYYFWGRATTILSFTIAMICVVSFINGASYIAGGALVTQWFPKKKGLVNGFTTMGHNMGSAFYVPLIAFLIGTYGYQHGMGLAAILGVVLGIIGLIFIKNVPQEVGMLPDNVSKEVYEREYFTMDANDDSYGWSISKLLKTKELWLCAIIVGLNQLVTTGVMSQLVVRNTGLGFDIEFAVKLMSICAVIGVAGSYLFGWIDQKYGVKRAVTIFLIWYMLALLVNITDTRTGVLISVPMIGVAIGAAANFIISLPASVFGRHGFAKVYAAYFPIMSTILFTNYIINATALRITGSLRGAYMVFVGILLVNVILINILDVRKFNRDYMTEEQLLNFES